MRTIEIIGTIFSVLWLAFAAVGWAVTICAGGTRCGRCGKWHLSDWEEDICQERNERKLT